MVPDLAWHGKNITKPMENGHVPDGLGLDREKNTRFFLRGKENAVIAPDRSTLGRRKIDADGNSGSTSIFLPIFSNAICCIMGFQLLELIDIPLLALNSGPVAKQSSSDEPILIGGDGSILPSKKKDPKEEQGSLVRTFLLGGSSALVASPCATPVLTSILAFVASSSNPFLGGFLLLFYTLGYV